ncbi:NPC intracellular cholesterol transporter 2-like [Ruditapes philippinarum]|uniref:NPC intracellular cholesterol transporter 2-like n=1 Tax=Ruditapes philippinarum TaxID=129788 RepID=UPI00295AA887|nr:NPC intracellular cholesterol transporter 2-like [Ruditapes philippinarum]
MLKLVVVFAIYCVATSFAVTLTRYIDCGSKAEIHSIVLEPCNSEPCIIHPLQDYTTHVTFTPRITHQSAYNFATGIIAGVPTPVNASPINACGNGLTCPIQAGLQQTYTATVQCPIVKPLRLAAKSELKDENNEDIICFVFPAMIVKY